MINATTTPPLTSPAEFAAKVVALPANLRAAFMQRCALHGITRDEANTFAEILDEAWRDVR